MSAIEIGFAVYASGAALTLAYFLGSMNHLRGKEGDGAIVVSLMLSAMWPLVWSFKLLLFVVEWLEHRGKKEGRVEKAFSERENVV